MRPRYLLIPLLAGVLMLVGCAGPVKEDREAVRNAIQAAANGDHRSAENIARNEYRHPVETLDFFGLKRDMTVAELWPGGGWYTEVLAPVLHEDGKLIAANFDPETDVEYQARMAESYLEKLADNPAVYGDVSVVPFDPPRRTHLGDPGSVDMVVTFRNLHSWINAGAPESVFRAALEVLRPGGTFGVVQHRARPDAEAEESAQRGYVPESYVIELAERVGFQLEGKSEINANPADDGNHQYGVWTLPPSFRACREIEDDTERENCEADFREIGESDRMTLRFVKPE